MQYDRHTAHVDVSKLYHNLCHFFIVVITAIMMDELNIPNRFITRNNIKLQVFKNLLISKQFFQLYSNLMNGEFFRMYLYFEKVNNISTFTVVIVLILL